MANSYNPPSGPNYSDRLKEVNARQLAQLDRYQNALRQNDQRRVQQAGQGMDLLSNLVDFSVSLKGVLDKKKEEEEQRKETENKTTLHGMYADGYTDEEIKAAEPEATTAGKIVESFGNEFSDMKSSRLADALRGAQEDIIQKRLDDGLTFPGML